LAEVDGISPRLGDRYGASLLAEVATAREIPESELPLYPRGQHKEKDPRAEKRLTHLKDWRQKAAKALELDPGVLINNATLEALAYRNPADDEGLQQVPLLKNWQRNELGKGILQTLSR
jgi:ribonuclease D